jgi:Lon protease-like protein
MKTNKINLPIFPLSIFILPEGVTKLRIFEPRYLKMVSIALKGQGFIIWARGDERSLSSSSWGSWVEIINFDQGPDGVLEVDVKCKSLVKIKSLETDIDSLHFGDVVQMIHWSQTENNSSLTELAKSLEKVFDKSQDLNDLYPEKEMNHSGWVLARWLELLPVDLDIKTVFVADHNFQEAKEFVQSLINK